MSRRKTDEKSPDFETALAELEKIVDMLENETLSLEQMLSNYERGCQLLRSCDDTLKNARQRLEKLSLREDAQENGLANDSQPYQDSPTATPHTDNDDDTISLF